MQSGRLQRPVWLDFQDRPVIVYDALDDVDGRERHDEHDRLIEHRNIYE